jgi:hypothetical protein
LALTSFNIEPFSKQVVKQLGADLSAKRRRKEPAMADKPEFIDMIGEATAQRRRRVMPRVVQAAPKEEKRLSHWPPDHLQQWRLENLTPWKLKPWKFRDWS